MGIAAWDNAYGSLDSLYGIRDALITLEVREGRKHGHIN